jgi:hypothetical protein
MKAGKPEVRAMGVRWHYPLFVVVCARPSPPINPHRRKGESL